jgi:hypothetical protein
MAAWRAAGGLGTKAIAESLIVLHGGARREGDSKSGTIALAIAAGGGREAILEFEAPSRTIAARQTMRRAPRVASAHALSGLGEQRVQKRPVSALSKYVNRTYQRALDADASQRRALSPARITAEISKEFQRPCNLSAQVLSENQNI